MQYRRLVRDEQLRDVSVSYFFVLIIALMLSKVFSEAHMSLSNKRNYKSFTKDPPVSLLHCIENVLNHSSGKCHDSLTMAALNLTKSTDLCTIFVHQYLLSNGVIISSKRDDNDTSLSFSSHTSLWYSRKLSLLGN